VRDFPGNAAQARTRSLSGRYQALDELDDSKIAKRKFRYWREIHLARDRIFHARDNHDLNHRSRPRASRQDNKSPRCTWRWDAVAGICSRRNFDFGDGARERAQALSPFCESNEHDPQNLVYSPQFLAEAEIVIARHQPSPQSSPRPPGEAVHSIGLLDWDIRHSSARIIQTRRKSMKGERASSNEEDAKSDMLQRPNDSTLQRFDGSTSRSAAK